MTDCLIIGFYDYNLEKYIETVAAYGKESGAYKDLDLALIGVDGKSYRALDILSHYYNEGRAGAGQKFRLFHNTDFIWPTITYLGSYLKKRGFTFDYVNLFHLEREKLREKLLTGKVLTVAITTTLYVIPQPILEIIEFIRGLNKTVKILVGGPYITNQMVGQDAAAIQSLFKLLGADIYVDSTEGEFALTRILTALKSGQSLEGVDNIAFKTDNGYQVNGKSVESNPLEENPVDYHLFPVEELGEFVSLRTAKSCPFACAFCGFPQRAGKYKYVPVSVVERELNVLRDLGSVTTITFLDDTFNVPKERFKELLRMMIRNNYGFRWNSFYRSDHGDEEVIELMGHAGCEGVFLGVESGCDSQLQNMNKTARTKDYRKAIPLLKAAGIYTHANLVVGFPGETYDTFQETCRFIEEVQPDTFRAQLWYADPVTPVWRKKDELGIKGGGFSWSHHTMDSRTACDLVDRMFLSIQNSIWLPQLGFETWSMFYLQRKGMPMGRIKDFIRCFNAIIREKLINPGRNKVDPTLLANLRASCQFDRGVSVVREKPELYSAEEYCAAERFWIAECGVAKERLRLFSPNESAGQPPASKYFRIGADVLQRLLALTKAEVGVALLAAYGAAVALWKRRNDVWIVADLGSKRTFPLNIEVPGSSDPNASLRRIEQKVPAALEHAAYAFQVLTNPCRMAERGHCCPPFECGYTIAASMANKGRQGSGNLDLYPKVKQGLKLTFEIMEAGREVRARFLYDRECISRTDIDELGEHMDALLRGEVRTSQPATVLRDAVIAA